MSQLSLSPGRADNVLLNVPSQFDYLPPSVDLYSPFDSVPSSMLQDHDRLLITITESCGYRVSCRYLVKAARKFSVFQYVSVANISIGSRLSRPAQLDREMLAETLTRLDLDWDAGDVRRLGMGFSQASTRFRERLPSLKVKVYAEIQLIFYFEMNRLLIPPRVICLSKKARLLRDPSVKLHGKFYIAGIYDVVYLPPS